MDDIAYTKFALIALPQVPVPALLSLMLGYDLTRGNRRFIGVARAFARPTISVSDGDDIYDCSPVGWDAFRSHRNVSPFLADYDFGDTTGYPKHMFVVDRKQRFAYVGSIEAVTCFLDRQEQRSGVFSLRGQMAVLGNISASLRLCNGPVYANSLNATLALLLPDLKLALDVHATH